jgi:hypothetical protein
MALLFIWAITASFEIYGIGPWIGATPYLLFLVGGIWWCLRDRRHQAAHALAAAALTVALLSSIAALWIAGFRGPIAWIDGIGSIGWFSIVTTPFNAVSFCLMLRAVFWANPSRDEAARPSGAPASPASHRQTAGLLTGAIACGLVGSFTAFSLHIGGLVAFALLTNRAMTDRSGLREWFLNWALFPLPAVLATGALAGAVIAARVVASRHSNSSG